MNNKCNCYKCRYTLLQRFTRHMMKNGFVYLFYTASAGGIVWAIDTFGDMIELLAR